MGSQLHENGKNLSLRKPEGLLLQVRGWIKTKQQPNLTC